MFVVSQVMSDLLEAPSSTHGCHQAASLVLRNLATDPDHSRAVATEGPDVIAALVGLLSQRHGHKVSRPNERIYRLMSNDE
jgi:hypothetical protein